jgi:hypothetical protein
MSKILKIVEFVKSIVATVAMIIFPASIASLGISKGYYNS